MNARLHSRITRSVAALAVATLVVSLGATEQANASRKASKSEARAMLKAYSPTVSSSTRIVSARVSTVDPRWAYMVLAHPKYGLNTILLRKRGGKWRYVNDGTGMTCDDAVAYQGISYAACADLRVGR